MDPSDLDQTLLASNSAGRLRCPVSTSSLSRHHTSNEGTQSPLQPLQILTLCVLLWQNLRKSRLPPRRTANGCTPRPTTYLQTLFTQVQLTITRDSSFPQPPTINPNGPSSPVRCATKRSFPIGIPWIRDRVTRLGRYEMKGPEDRRTGENRMAVTYVTCKYIHQPIRIVHVKSHAFLALYPSFLYLAIC
jgi:hypothetical protein